MRKTYWRKGSDSLGQFTSFWKMLCYKDNDEPVTGEKITIDYREFIE
jgi:hypothetical protein